MTISASQCYITLILTWLLGLIPIHLNGSWILVYLLLIYLDSCMLSDFMLLRATSCHLHYTGSL